MKTYLCTDGVKRTLKEIIAVTEADGKVSIGAAGPHPDRDRTNLIHGYDHHMGLGRKTIFFPKVFSGGRWVET